jgi:hypothetical protein
MKDKIEKLRTHGTIETNILIIIDKINEVIDTVNKLIDKPSEDEDLGKAIDKEIGGTWEHTWKEDKEIKDSEPEITFEILPVMEGKYEIVTERLDYTVEQVTALKALLTSLVKLDEETLNYFIKYVDGSSKNSYTNLLQEILNNLKDYKESLKK